MQIFYARIPNTITEEELKEVFQRAGSVKEVVLFKAHAGATINKVSPFKSVFPAKVSCRLTGFL